MSEKWPFGVAIRNVAIATDFSPWSDRATQHALVVAHRFGATLHLLHTVRRSEFSLVPNMMVQLEELARRDCEGLICRLNAAHSLDGIEHQCWTVEGEVPGVFESFIQDHKIDLLILGTRGRTGLSKFLLGSIAQQISRHVFCPVLTVSPWSRGATRQLEMKKVLFATDLSPGAAAAIPYMLTAAKTWSTEIDVLHVCSSEHSTCRQLMDDFSHRIDSLAKSEPRFTIRRHIVHGEPSRAVLDFARQNKEDLIVLGLDRHRSLYNGPSFSHAYEIVRQAQCPVLNVRSCRSSTAGS